MGRFNLNKGERFKLDKSAGLENIRVDLTWASSADLDAQAFCLGDDGSIIEDADFVYYNSAKRTLWIQDGETDQEFLARVKEAPFDRKVYGAKKNWLEKTAPLSFDESVVGSYDDPGADDDSDDEAGETLRVRLAKVRPEISEIVFTVTIYHGDEEGTTFKDVKDAKISVVNADTDEELCAYPLNEKFTGETAVVVASLKLNDDGEWEFEARGEGYDGGLETLVDMFS